MSVVRKFLLNDGTQIPRTAWGCGTAQAGSDVGTLTANAVRAGIYHLDGAQASPSLCALRWRANSLAFCIFRVIVMRSRSALASSPAGFLARSSSSRPSSTVYHLARLFARPYWRACRSSVSTLSISFWSIRRVTIRMTRRAVADQVLICAVCGKRWRK